MRMLLLLLLFLFSSNIFFASTSSVTLKNGLKITVSSNNLSEVVSLAIVSRIGLLDENERNCGITYLVQQMLFEGTRKRSSSQIQSIFHETGVKIESKIELDNSYIIFTTSKRNFPKILDVALDMIFNPLLSEAGLKKQKEILVKRTKAKNTNLLEDSYWLLMKHFYKKGHLAFGNYPPEDIINNIHKEEILEWYKKIYSPNNIVISISGNFIPQNAISKIKEFENVMPTTGISLQDEEKGSVCYETVISKNINLSIVMIIFKRKKTNTTDYFLLQVLSQIMSDANSDMIYNIKEKLSIAYSMDIKFTNDGIIIYSICSPKNIEKLKSAIFWEIAKIKQKEIDNSILKKAQEYLISNYYIDMQKNALKSYYLGLAEILNIGYNSHEQYPDIIKSITGEQLRKVAQEHLKDYCLVVVSPDTNNY